MNYFQTLPKLLVKDKQSIQVATNLLARVNIISSLIEDPLIYYSYDIQDSDTPEIIAHKYYGSMSRFWMVLFANQILDPQWDWPLTGAVFDSYVNGKYTLQQLSLPHHYEKIITNTTIPDGSVSSKTITMSEEEYNNLSESSNTYSTVTGNVNISISKNVVDNYTYELDLNQSKRNIKILNKIYVDKLEVEFNKLMNT